MPSTYNGCGIQFLYPENWNLSEEEDAAEDTQTIMLESPEGVFFSIHRLRRMGGPGEAIERALEAMRGEYPEIEVEESGALSVAAGATGVLDPLTESGADLSFYYLDLLITVRMLAISTGGDVLLMQMQGESRDFDKQERVLAAIIHSIRNSLPS